jgi:hypothetical protein
MNLRRGFHRVFLISWVLYSAVILLLPFYEAKKQTDSLIDIATVGYFNCIGTRRNQGDSIADVERFCSAKRDEKLKNWGVGPWIVWRGLWLQLGWHSLWVVPVVLLVPPLITYGTIRLIVKTSLWVAKGFRESQGSA